MQANNSKEESLVAVPRCLIDEIMSRLDKIESQNRVLQEMVMDDQVARMSTEYLDLEQAQSVLHCKAKTLERLRMKGDLAFYQYGKKIVIRRSDIDAFLDAHKKNRDYLDKVTDEPEIPFSDTEEGKEGGEADGES